jgi:hypothetical protein
LFAGADGQALSDGVQPAADAGLPTNGSGPPGQNEKGCLKRIFGVVVMTDCESAQQFAIAALGGAGDAVQSPQMVENGVQRIAGHETRLTKEK